MTEQEKIKWMERVKKLTEIRQKAYWIMKEMDEAIKTIVSELNEAIENGVNELAKGSKDGK